jgi:hypothetical protein
VRCHATETTTGDHITNLLRAGVHPKVVSERAGHASVAFTLQRYAHALPDMQRDAADQMQCKDLSATLLGANTSRRVRCQSGANLRFFGLRLSTKLLIRQAWMGGRVV